MGAKTWMLVYANGSAREALKRKPPLDRNATQRLASSLFPGETLHALPDGDLSYTCPPDDEIHLGCFSGVSIVAAKEMGIDYPSRLPMSLLAPGADRNVYLHAMHSVVDWFAFAVWNKGSLIRSLSLAPDNGILENIGAHLPFEESFWEGEHSALCDEEEKEAYPFPFHPLDLGEAALAEFFGYHLEGVIDSSLLEPESIPLLRFKRSRPWWKFWR